MNDHATVDHEEPLCLLLTAAARATANAYRPGLARLGLTFAQFSVLVVLWGDDGLCGSDLAARLQLDASTLSPLLRRMEAMGLVARHRCPDDERRVRIHLTKAGKALREPARQVAHDVSSRLELSKGDAAVLRRLARQVVESGTAT